MTPMEMIKHCEKQIELQGKDAQVGFLVPGKWGKNTTKRLCPGGPKGEIVSDMQRGCYCFFNAREVIDFLNKKLQEVGMEGRQC